MSDVDKWIEIAKRCKYLPEDDLRELCNIVCDLLLEEPNVQPVQTPVTVCGDIHGQVILNNNNKTFIYSLRDSYLYCSSYIYFWSQHSEGLSIAERSHVPDIINFTADDYRRSITYRKITLQWHE